jgi:hypothetical protein
MDRVRRCRRVSEKNGFRCAGTFTDDGGAVMIRYRRGYFRIQP